MQVGMNLLAWTMHVTEAHFPILARLKQVGFDGVEIPLSKGDGAHYQAVRKELDNLELACTTALVEDLAANPISPDSAVRKAAVERQRWALEMTAVLGGGILNGEFHTPRLPPAEPVEEERSRAADVFREAAEIAQLLGIRLAIEYLNRFESYFLTTAADTLAMVKRVNHPNFGMMYDTFHAHIEEKNPAAAIEAAADCLIHVHISENDRGIPGTGQVRWGETFGALRRIGYDGWLTIESFSRALPDLATAMRIWRDVFLDAHDVSTHGVRFIREQWADAGRHQPLQQVVPVRARIDSPNPGALHPNINTGS
jgi:D-psicose/D-tagatose/L-ribulose 3-epimerase